MAPAPPTRAPVGGKSRPPLPQEERKRIPAKVLALQELPRSRRTPARVQLTLEFLPYPGTNTPWQADYTLRADQVDRRAVVGRTVLVEYREDSPGQYQVLRIVRPLTSSGEEADERLGPTHAAAQGTTGNLLINQASVVMARR